MTRSALAKIHIAKKEIGMDDMAYRAMLNRITKQTSSANMTDRQHVAVLAEFKRLGWDQQAGMRRKKATAQSDLFTKAGRQMAQAFRQSTYSKNLGIG